VVANVGPQPAQIPGLEPRSALALAASALAGLATVVSSDAGDGDLVPFFVILTFGAGVIAALVRTPFEGQRRAVARLLSVAWLVAAVWIGSLLVWYQVACGCSRPMAEGLPPEPMYLGLPPSAFHLAATYAGMALVLVATFGRAERRRQDRRATNSSNR
jgi:hypothetical protein